MSNALGKTHLFKASVFLTLYHLTVIVHTIYPSLHWNHKSTKMYFLSPTTRQSFLRMKIPAKTKTKQLSVPAIQLHDIT